MAKIRITEAGSETAPAVGQLALYAKTDHNLYLITPAGVERKIFDDSMPGIGAYDVEQFTLTAMQVGTAQITLATPPAFPTKTLLQVDGAGPSFYGVDFTVTGSTLSWSGLRLEGLLEAGDLIQVVYIV